MEPKRLALSLGLVLSLGMLITVFSVYHMQHMGGSYQYPLFLYGTTLLALAVGGSIVYLLGEKVDAKRVEKLLAILPTDERKVLRLLLERKEVEQKRLVTLTGLSAVKTSRVLTTLASRGVVEKHKHGYTNLVTLKL